MFGSHSASQPSQPTDRWLVTPYLRGLLITDQVVDPIGLDTIFLPPNDDTTLPDPATHGYIDGGCVDEMAMDGATVEPGTDATDWNASYGQGGGGMTANLSGLLGWAEAASGNELLDDSTVEQRLNVQPLPKGIPYGLGIMQLGPWIGHEGEAIGWEALALHDPDSGVSIALAGNGCGGLFTGFLEVLGTLYPDHDGRPRLTLPGCSVTIIVPETNTTSTP